MRGDGHGNLVGSKARQGQGGLALLRDGDRYALTCHLLARARVRGFGARAAPHACYIHIRHLPCHLVIKPAPARRCVWTWKGVQARSVLICGSFLDRYYKCYALGYYSPAR
jgi:hypothetical protein